MAISMVRQPSTEPNIDNISDIIPFRYAYGGQNGYVKGKGRELDYTAIGNQFTVGSGRVVLDGVESDIDSDGFIINVDTVSETRYYVVYYNVNLANNTTTITSQYATGTYPTISTGDDLTENPEGSANLILYRFTATSGIISNVEKVVQPIEYGGSALNGYDISKGTIEQRFRALGFKEGSVEIPATYTTTQNYIKRQGNYVIGKVVFDTSAVVKPTEIDVVVPEEFRPINNETVGVVISGAIDIIGGSTGSFNSSINASGYITSNGRLFVSVHNGSIERSLGSYTVRADTNLYISQIIFGYEANPL